MPESQELTKSPALDSAGEINLPPYKLATGRISLSADGRSLRTPRHRTFILQNRLKIPFELDFRADLCAHADNLHY